jgi:hypothetical protein
MFSSSLRRYTPAFLVSLAFVPGTTEAQPPPPILTVTGASVFEGDSGTRNLVFTVSLSSPSNSPVSALVFLFGEHGASPGVSCAANVDFVGSIFGASFPFNMAANTPVATFNVTICGDTVLEGGPSPFFPFLDQDEQIRVSLSNVVGAQCSGPLGGTCNGVGTILDDDGPVGIRPNIITVNEPPLGGTRVSVMTVTLSHPSETFTRVNFSTEDFNARGAISCAPSTSGGIPDYVSRSGSLTIPPNTLSGTISLTVCGDNIFEPSEVFYVRLSNPVNGTITGVGQAIIRNFGVAQVGEFALSPGEAKLQVGERVTYTVDWTVPAGKVWRDLDTIDFRIRGGRTALWVRWEEAANTFKLCRKGGGDHDNDRDEDENEGEDDQDFKGGPGLRCGPGATPGTTVVLETPLAQLHLDRTSVVGSGPTGPSVALGLTVSFKGKAAGHRYGVEVAARDDFGNSDDFFRLGRVKVRRP